VGGFSLAYGGDALARQEPHLPGASTQTRHLLEFADLAALKAAGSKGDLHVGLADSSNTLTEAAAIDGL
jgi:hypothetical protein